MAISVVGEIHPNPIIEAKRLTSQVATPYLLVKYATDPMYVGLMASGDQPGCYMRALTTRTTAQIAAGENIISVENLEKGKTYTLISSGVLSVGVAKYVVPDDDGKVKAATENATPVATWVLGKVMRATTTDGDMTLVKAVMDYVII